MFRISLNRFVLITALAVNGNFVSAQTSDRQVINSTGGSGSAGISFNVDYSIGETVIVTGSTGSNFFTQGFLQPDTIFTSSGIFSVSLYYSSESCISASDGYIIANAINASGPVTWLWMPTGDTVQTLTGLVPGMYILTASDTAGNSVVDTVEITASTSPCDLEFFNGITPNNDGKNDQFIISNISTYAENSLFIYNRYGNKVWEGKNYDNVNVVFEGKASDGTDLPPATYFYILSVQNGERKGWVEVIR